MAKGKLRVATCQFAESYNPERNAGMVLQYMQKAKKQRAEIVHFHETCLSGYFAVKGAPAMDGYDWSILREAGDRVCAEAKRLGLWRVLGSSHPLTPPHKPTNCLYVIGPDGKVRDRYDKRFCTNGDLKAYTPGDRFVTFIINGVKCGLLICYDVRFPELHRQLYRKGVKMLFHSFHNANASGPNIHTKIMRQTVQAHAGINHMWTSANNSNRRHSSWPSIFVKPNGEIAASLTRNVAGLMVNTVDLAEQVYDASRPFRDRSIRGVLHSGRSVDDARISNHKSL